MRRPRAENRSSEKPLVPDLEMLRMIGSGAFGEVWLGRNVLGAYRAIKIVYRKSFRDQAAYEKEFSGLQRFEPISREHEGFVDILQVGRNDEAGFFYYVMELADDDLGRENVLPEAFAPKTLSSLLAQQKRLSVEECVHLGLSLTEALDRLHTAGLVHRDIKPSNIIFVNGVPKLADIGLVAEPGQQTFVGTDGYIPPEGPGSVGADLYALGKVVYQCATAKDRLDFPDLPTGLAEMPDSERLLKLNAVILKACDANVRRRYRTAADMHDDLAQIIPGQSVIRGRRKRLRRSVLVAGITAVAGAAALLLGLALLVPYTMSPQRAKEISLAVLPFVNMSPNQQDEYLSDGMTEELINTLSMVPELQVKARTSSFAFKGKHEDVRKIGQQLGVPTLLEGSVSRAGNKLRITAQLIDVATGNHLWSQTYDREMQDIFAIRTEVAQQVAEALKVRLGVSTKQAIAKKPTDNLEAYQLYLQGRFYWGLASGDSAERALDYFNRAIALDPNYALAYAGLADTYATAAASMAPKEAFPKAKEAAVRAVELDDSLAESHISLGLVKLHYDWDWDGAEKEFKRAIALNDKLAQAYDEYALFLCTQRRFDEALGEIKKALDLDPLSAVINADFAFVLLLSKQYDQAVEQAKRVVKLSPANTVARMQLAWGLWFQGNHAKAIETYQSAAKLEPDNPMTLSGLGFMYGKLGNRTGARQMIERLNELSVQRYISPASIARIHGGLGDKEQTIDWLEKAYEERSNAVIWLYADPGFDDFRAEPRFKALLRKIGFEQ